ncbi:hypothetical protein IH979_01390 [Patescibacteria group bacterium]|nr:hypothetical protein [Patescibacteria group bacterium]
MFNPTADNLAFATAGAEGMRIDTSGNVGIGVLDPDAKLEIQSNAAETGFALNVSSQNGAGMLVVSGNGDVGLGVTPTSILSFAMGTGSGQAQASGKANVNTTAVGNVLGGDDDLMTYSLPANSLSADGKGVRISAWGTSAANGNTKTVKLHFGSTVLRQVGPSALNAQDWRIEATLIRTGASTQDAVGTELVDNSSVFITHSEPAEDTTGAIIIKVSAESGSSASNDIVQEGMLIEYLN